jgi:hypothetical protein
MTSNETPVRTGTSSGIIPVLVGILLPVLGTNVKPSVRPRRWNIGTSKNTVQERSGSGEVLFRPQGDYYP